MYIICLGMITLIALAILIDNCEKKAEGGWETIVRNNDTFHELEVCTTSYPMIFQGTNIYIALLGLIGLSQIFYAYFAYQDAKEKRTLATAGQLLFIFSVCILYVLRNSITVGM